MLHSKKINFIYSRLRSNMKLMVRFFSDYLERLTFPIYSVIENSIFI